MPSAHAKALWSRILNNDPKHPGYGLYYQYRLAITYRGDIKQALRILINEPNILLSFGKKWLRTTLHYIGNDVLHLCGLAKTESRQLHDQRFKHSAWQGPFFHAMAASWLNFEECLEELMSSLQAQMNTEQLEFATKTLTGLLSLQNWPIFNPQIYQTTFEKHGLNLIKGGEKLTTDLFYWQGFVNFEKTDRANFQLGKTIATTKGVVINKDPIKELLYFPSKKEQAYASPILICPSWINKYYLFDLKPKNSLIKWLGEQGFNVYILSWHNPMNQEDITIEDYLHLGLNDAIEQVSARHHTPIHLVGNCLGGLLTTFHASLHPNTLRSHSLFATLLDFTYPGPLNHLMQAPQQEYCQQFLNERGHWQGQMMASAFNLLDPENFISPFWLNRYWLDRRSLSHDALAWSIDTTNIPSALYRFYMEGCFRDNIIAKHLFKISGQTICPENITAPQYYLAFQDDLITPLKGALKTAALLPRCTFTYAGGGHFNGIINPPKKNQYGYLTGPMDKHIHLFEQQATFHKGSWWRHWQQWLVHLDAQIAPSPDMPKEHTPTPGEYVHQWCE